MSRSSFQQAFLAGYGIGSEKAEERARQAFQQSIQEENQRRYEEGLTYRNQQDVLQAQRQAEADARANQYLQLQQQYQLDAAAQRNQAQQQRQAASSALYGQYSDLFGGLAQNEMGPPTGFAGFTQDQWGALPQDVQLQQTQELQRQQQAQQATQQKSVAIAEISKQAAAAEREAARMLALNPRDPIGMQLQFQGMTLRNRAMEMSTGASVPAGMMAPLAQMMVNPASGPDAATQAKQKAIMEFAEVTVKAAQLAAPKVSAYGQSTPPDPGVVKAAAMMQKMAAQRAMAAGATPQELGMVEQQAVHHALPNAMPGAPGPGAAGGAMPAMSPAQMQMLGIAAKRKAMELGQGNNPDVIEQILRSLLAAQQGATP